MVQRICRNCGIEYQAKHPRGIYCSGRCGYEWRASNNPPCSIDGCDHPRQRQGMCQTHFTRKRDGRPIDAPVKRRRKWGVVCAVEGCGRSGGRGNGLCGAHAYRLKRYGDVQAERPVKALAPKGAGYVDSNGYRCINGTK